MTKEHHVYEFCILSFSCFNFLVGIQEMYESLDIWPLTGFTHCSSDPLSHSLRNWKMKNWFVKNYLTYREKAYAVYFFFCHLEKYTSLSTHKHLIFTFKHLTKTANLFCFLLSLRHTVALYFLAVSLRSQTKQPSPEHRGSSRDFEGNNSVTLRAGRKTEKRALPRRHRVLWGTGCCHQNDICKIPLLLLWLCNCSAKRKSCKAVSEGREFAT